MFAVSARRRREEALSLPHLKEGASRAFGESKLDEGAWMTYAEAAERLGIQTDSVRRRADLSGWERRVGDDRLAQVHIPDYAFKKSKKMTKRRKLNNPTVAKRICRRAKSEKLEAEVEDLKRKLEDSQGLWMTYAEAGKRLGIKTESVRRRAFARAWRRKLGDDGLARVLVPRQSFRVNKIQPETPDPASQYEKQLIDERIRSAKLEAEIKALRLRLGDVAFDRDRWHLIATANKPGFIEWASGLFSTKKRSCPLDMRKK